MGTIVTRKRLDGTIGYTAQIVIKRKGKNTHREAKTFDRAQAAKAWMAKRETEIREKGPEGPVIDPPLSDVIDQYIKESEKEIGRTKAQVLRTIKTYDIAGKRCSQIESDTITDFAKQLDMQPQTRGNYLSHLASIFAVARPMWKYPLDYAAMKDAQTVLRRLGIISKSKERDRRPTLDELDKLMSHFQDRQKRRKKSAQMCRLIAFAIFSTRRQEEITRLAWSDFEEEHKRVMVRDMKHPGQKDGNDTWCDLPEPAVQIIKTMPRSGELIFPYSADAISAAFTRACAFLEIKDLHFHDLRHEGVSWLFETGYNIPHAAAVSGHRSWTSLKRYTQVRQRGDKYAGWKWLDVVTTS
ncbi:site-specific integrase [Bradyrhizobium cenepequi]